MKTSYLNPLASTCVLRAASTVFFAIFAQTAFAQSAFAQSVTAPVAKIATREEIRYCLDTADSLKATQKELEAFLASSKTQSEAMKKQADQLAADKEKLDATSSDQIEAWNSRVDEANKVRTTYNETVEKSRERTKQFNADRDVYTKRCDGMNAKPSDMEAVKKERLAK